MNHVRAACGGKPSIHFKSTRILKSGGVDRYLLANYLRLKCRRLLRRNYYDFASFDCLYHLASANGLHRLFCSPYVHVHAHCVLPYAHAHMRIVVVGDPDDTLPPGTPSHAAPLTQHLLHPHQVREVSGVVA